MRTRHGLTVLFVAAAGPRIGFGHLVRCGVLAGAMGVPPRVALRATSSTRAEARALGWHVHPTLPSILGTLKPALVVVDEPDAGEARRWIRAARALRVPVAAIRDLGLHDLDADLTIDGSLAAIAGARPADLQGPQFAILHPAILALRQQAQPRLPRRVVIALGGGAHVRQRGPDLAACIRDCAPDVEVRLAPGFRTSDRPPLPPGCDWLTAHGLREELAAATVAVVAGGVTLYEACALGTPLVTLAVAGPQRITTSAGAAAGAVIDASDTDLRAAVRRAASLVSVLLETADVRAALGSTAARIVDGLGTARVIAHLRALLLTHPRGRESHAA
jgi:hypothetical protein